MHAILQTRAMEETSRSACLYLRASDLDLRGFEEQYADASEAAGTRTKRDYAALAILEEAVKHWNAVVDRNGFQHLDGSYLKRFAMTHNGDWDVPGKQVCHSPRHSHHAHFRFLFVVRVWVEQPPVSERDGVRCYVPWTEIRRKGGVAFRL
jgi:hypothetical protein